jgi:broad specificity phosphatase PhoE
VEPKWSHSGKTDIPLTDNGRRLAGRVRPVLATKAFALVLCSPMQRARETCKLPGLCDKAVIDPDLMEWNYGKYEGLTPKQIHEIAPRWLVFRGGCQGGESPEQVGARTDGVIARSRAADGDVALFAYRHALRVFIARWVGLPSRDDEHFLLNTGTLCVLGTKNRLCGSGTRLSPNSSSLLLMSLKAKIGKIKRNLSGGWKVISNALASF